MCCMAEGAAEPKSVDGRWETIKDIWIKTTEDDANTIFIEYIKHHNCITIH